VQYHSVLITDLDATFSHTKWYNCWQLVHSIIGVPFISGIRHKQWTASYSSEWKLPEGQMGTVSVFYQSDTSSGKVSSFLGCTDELKDHFHRPKPSHKQWHIVHSHKNHFCFTTLTKLIVICACYVINKQAIWACRWVLAATYLLS